MTDPRFIPAEPGSTPEGRVRQMFDAMEEALPSPAEGRAFAVACDICRLRLWIEAPADADIVRLATLAMTGWTRSVLGDVCPECSA